MAVLAFALADMVGGNGFVAAFCAGMALGRFGRDICGSLTDFGEAEGQLLASLAFVAFGALILPELLAYVSGAGLLYDIASLTVIRMLPVAVSLVGKRLRWQTVTFLGRFGPRGIASILFGLLVLEAAPFPGKDLVIEVVGLTVFISIVAPVLSAVPGVAWYARCADSCAAAPQHVTMPEIPTRTRG
ncbi:MAG: NhaP-type Na+/H+ or K+/H+ antiporter [Myxococcota bacterium]|jgi:NhaP-type Na+/H+ or K+/H+ antiporter